MCVCINTPGVLQTLVPTTSYRMSEALMHLFFLDNKSGEMSGEQQHEDSGGQKKVSESF